MAYLLIVEDELDQGKGFQIRYGNHCKCVLAQFPEDALELIESEAQQIGGVLLDIRMAHRGRPFERLDDHAGVPVMQAIRQHCRAETPVVLASVLQHNHPAVVDCIALGGMFCDKGDSEVLDDMILNHLIPAIDKDTEPLTVEARLDIMGKEITDIKALLAEIQKQIKPTFPS